MDDMDPFRTGTGTKQASATDLSSKRRSSTSIDSGNAMSIRNLRNLCLIVLTLALAGCGVDWFPVYKRLATTPDPFPFTQKTDVARSSQITSDSITVAGLTADTSPISITGSDGSNSKYSINGAAAVDTAGTVKNGDLVTVTHTSATGVGSETDSSLSIGDVTETFTSVTVLVAIPAFTAKTGFTGQTIVSDAVTIVSRDGIAGTHIVSVKDEKDSTNAMYSFDNNSWTNNFVTNSAVPISALNGRTIYLRNTVPSVTTLTIDGVTATYALTTP
jgi:hypothetical protein